MCAPYFCLFIFFQELKKLGLGPAVNLHVTEVPVEYKAVQNLLPSLWDQYKPQVLLFGTLFHHQFSVFILIWSASVRSVPI